MSRVLSYLREGSFEYLADHVNSCLSFLDELRESKMGRAGSTINCRFPDSVRIAVVFHDLGKAFYEKGRWKNEGYMSFPGHELISAYILGKYEEKIYEKGELYRSGDISPEEMSEILTPSLFAVVLHHHAMDLNERLSYLDRVKLRPSHFDDLKQELSLLQSDAVLPEEREILYRVLDEARSKVEGGALNTREIGRYVRENVLYGIYEYFRGGREENIRMKKLCYLCLVSLVTADYMAAGEKRGGKTKFSDVIREFHEIYMKRVL